jgi:transcriptional regulator of arginine metabolism
MKYARHSKILELIQNHEVETQQELAELLKKNGFDVTQATVSRDIKELRLLKILTKSGKYKYAASNENDQIVSDRFLKLFKDSVLSIDSAGNMVVVKTLVGAANAAAAAIDALNLENIVGSLAGDDTIFLLVNQEENVSKIKDVFKKIMED